MKIKYRITWENNGKTFQRIVTKSQLANTIEELSFPYYHTLTVEAIEED